MLEASRKPQAQSGSALRDAVDRHQLGVQELVTEAAELPADELAPLLEAIRELPSRAETVPSRHAVIAERIGRVQASDVSSTVA